jgi:hypothetical protein
MMIDLLALFVSRPALFFVVCGLANDITNVYRQTASSCQAAKPGKYRQRQHQPLEGSHPTL